MPRLSAETSIGNMSGGAGDDLFAGGDDLLRLVNALQAALAAGEQDKVGPCEANVPPMFRYVCMHCKAGKRLQAALAAGWQDKVGH